MSIHIRSVRPDDYAGIATVSNRAQPDDTTTADEIRFGDEHRNPSHRWARFVAEDDGHIVGVALFAQFSDAFHPQRFWTNIYVDPDYQRRGIGTALYARVEETLRGFDVQVLRSFVREDFQHGVRFLNKHGFAEEFRAWESVLSVPEFDPAPFADHAAKTAARGITIKTMQELVDDPDRDRKLYDLVVAASEDEPRPDPYTPVSFDFFVDRELNDPGLLQDGYFVAIDDGQYAGMTQLYRSEGSDELRTGFTGVRREHRRRGIALALKLRAIEYAQQHNAPQLVTHNHSINRPMLSINEALGFAKRPSWINVRRDF